MTNEEILNKVIQKAKDNGFNLQDWYGKEFDVPLSYRVFEKECIEWLLAHPTSFGKLLIFNKDFAKAFWREELCQLKESHKVKGMPIEKLMNGKSIPTNIEEITMTIELPTWQHHLRLMVLEEEPIKYLEKFL